MLIIKEKKVPKYLDEEGDFFVACLRTCEDNLWETILGCIIEDDVLVAVAFLVAKGPYYTSQGHLSTSFVFRVTDRKDSVAEPLYALISEVFELKGGE